MPQKPTPHFAEALEHLEWIKAKFKENLQKSRERKEREQAEAQEATKRKHQEEFKRVLNGTTFQKVQALLNDLDYSKDTKKTPIFSPKETAQIRASIDDTAQAGEANRYVNFYNAIIQIYQTLALYREQYRKEAGKLTALIKTYEGYLATAKALSNAFKDGVLVSEEGTTIYFEFGEGEDGKLCADKKEGSGWGTLTTTSKGDWEVDIEGYTKSGEPRLYQRMLYQADTTEAYLSRFKSYIEAVEDIFLYSIEAPVWSIIPLTMEELLEYPDYIPEQNQEAMRRYFRFPLNQRRRETGQEPSPEEEKWAIYPDINEVETTEKYNKEAKTFLSVILDRWELDSKTLKKICAEAIMGSKK